MRNRLVRFLLKYDRSLGVVVVVDNFIVPLGQLGLQHSRKSLRDMTQTNSPDTDRHNLT